VQPNELNPSFDALAAFLANSLAAIIAGMHKAGTIDAQHTLAWIRRLGEISDGDSYQGAYQGLALMAESFCQKNPPGQ